MNRQSEEAANIAGVEIDELTKNFSGVIFRKAEMENNFEKVYTRVIEKMVEFEFSGNNCNVLDIFGGSGG